MNSRTLGLACMVGSGVAALDGVRLVLVRHRDIPGFRDVGTLDAVAQVVWAVGMGCGFLALLALRATGDRRIYRWLTWVPVVGSALAIVGFALLLAGVPTSRNVPGIAGQLLSQLGLLIVAIVVLVTRTWRSWRRYTPLMVVLTIPVGAILVELTTLDGVFITLNASAWLLLGYALLTTTPVRELVVRANQPDQPVRPPLQAR